MPIAKTQGSKKHAPKKNVALRAKTKTVAKRRSVKRVHTHSPVIVSVCRHVCTPEERFWINNGPIIESIAELRTALVAMSDDQFRYHAEGEINDFAEWLRHSLCHLDCAQKIAMARTRVGALRALATCDC